VGSPLDCGLFKIDFAAVLETRRIAHSTNLNSPVRGTQPEAVDSDSEILRRTISGSGTFQEMILLQLAGELTDLRSSLLSFHSAIRARLMVAEKQLCFFIERGTAPADRLLGTTARFLKHLL